VVSAAVERDNFMSPAEAKAFGLVDEVLLQRPARENAGEGGSS